MTWEWSVVQKVVWAGHWYPSLCMLQRCVILFRIIETIYKVSIPPSASFLYDLPWNVNIFNCLSISKFSIYRITKDIFSLLFRGIVWRRCVVKGTRLCYVCLVFSGRTMSSMSSRSPNCSCGLGSYAGVLWRSPLLELFGWGPRLGSSAGVLSRGLLPVLF